MSRLIDTGAWDHPHNSAAGTSRGVELSYVLVADANVQRAAACLESIKPFNVGVLVARDGDEAVRILERFGPPILLIIDLSLSRKDGFAVIEALCGVDRGRTSIIAWSAFRELREYATHRLSGLNVRVLGGAVGPGVVKAAIDRALRKRATADASSNPSPELTAADLHQTMTELSEKARQLCGTPGVAVYLRASAETQFRASVTWTSDAPIPHSPYYVPRVFGWILETGEALVLPDLATQPLSDVPTSTLQDVVRGLVAVPIVSTDQQIVGTICVFDMKPLTLGDADVEALKALGRGISVGPTAIPLRAESDRQPLPRAATDEAQSDAVVGSPSVPLPAIEAPDRESSRGPTGVPIQAEENSQPPPGPAPGAGRSDDALESQSAAPSATLLDRRVGDFAIARELARARRENRQLSVVLFDVGPLRPADGPKESVRERLAVRETLTRAIRGSDLAIRWRGDELLVVLFGLGMSEARAVAERVRAALQAGAQHLVAVSAGVAELLANEPFESVVRRANEKLQAARERGHNRVA